MIPTPVAVDEQLPEPEVACSLLCRVCRRASRPTSDSEIHHEVWMPASGWNGKLDHGGNAGYGGSLGTPAGFMLDGLLRGYSTTGTDMGHNAARRPAPASRSPIRRSSWIGALVRITSPR